MLRVTRVPTKMELIAPVAYFFELSSESDTTQARFPFKRTQRTQRTQGLA